MKKRFTEEQIIGFLKEVDSGTPVMELCRKHGFPEASYYLWRSEFGGVSVPEATRLSSSTLITSPFVATTPNSKVRNDYWQLLGIPHSGGALISEVRKGFDYDVYVKLSKETGLRKRQVAQILGITKATLNRRAAVGK